eukprot:Em0019g675a
MWKHNQLSKEEDMSTSWFYQSERGTASDKPPLEPSKVKLLEECLYMRCGKNAVEEKLHDIRQRIYTKAQKVLCQYQHMPSFSGIQQDCAVIVGELRTILKTRLEDSNSSTETITKSVDLLLALGDPPNMLCQHFLASAGRQLEQSLQSLEAKEVHYHLYTSGTRDGTQRDNEAQGSTDGSLGSETSGGTSSEAHVDTETQLEEKPRRSMGIVEFVSELNAQFLTNVCLVIQSCTDMFIKRQAKPE